MEGDISRDRVLLFLLLCVHVCMCGGGQWDMDGRLTVLALSIDIYIYPLMDTLPAS